jgi:peptidoglycan/xylan/chitin deacetylase (PgdA/CDA1 family)
MVPREDASDQGAWQTMIRFRRLLKQAIASPIGWRVVSRHYRQPGVSVLMYHRVTAPDAWRQGLEVDVFRQQMRWLRRRCLIIRPEDLLRYVAAPRTRRPPVLITFDDGYRDFYDNAFPILSELEIPSVVFLSTSYIDNGGLIWTDGLAWAVASAADRQVRLPWSEARVFDLCSADERSRLLHAAKAHLTQVPDAERKEALAQLFEELGVWLHDAKIERQMMTWEEVRSTGGLTSIGGHSHTHPILSQLDEAAMETEISLCRECILSQTGEAPKCFAYPNGRQQDFSDATKRLLRHHGFELAFSTIEGINGPDVDPLAIRRQPTGAANMGDFACLVGAM